MRSSGSVTPSKRAFSRCTIVVNVCFWMRIQQSFFGFEIVVKARQRHAALAREIAHRSAFISLFTENFGGVREDLGQPAVVAGYGRAAGRMPARCHPSCCRRTSHWSRRLIRTFVRIEYTPSVILITSGGS